MATVADNGFKFAGRQLIHASSKRSNQFLPGILYFQYLDEAPKLVDAECTRVIDAAGKPDALDAHFFNELLIGEFELTEPVLIATIITNDLLVSAIALLT